MIKKLFLNQIPIPREKIIFSFSGRVALNLLAKKLKNTGTVLIPNYICNVVDEAFLREEFTIKRYSLHNTFEPNIDEIIDMILHENVDVLLLASLYGSGCFLDELYNKESKLSQTIKKYHIDVIIDFAQDFNQINHLSLSEDNYHYVFSFNDKSFLGSMGGIIITKLDFLELTYEELSIKNRLILIKNYVVKIITCKAKWLLRIYRLMRGVTDNKQVKKEEFEFSECILFPYTYKNYKISNIQVFIAWIGLLRLSKYRKGKNKIFNQNNDFLNTKYVKMASYIINIQNSMSYKNKRKKPYALFDDKTKSLYPDINIIHNKGFCDK